VEQIVARLLLLLIVDVGRGLGVGVVVVANSNSSQDFQHCNTKSKRESISNLLDLLINAN
jgi:hypothetical protein